MDIKYTISTCYGDSATYHRSVRSFQQVAWERNKPFYVGQFEGLKQFVDPEDYGLLKITMCAPEWFHLRHGEYAYSKDAYKNDGEDVLENERVSY